MNTILSSERRLYVDLWSDVPSYAEHSPGEAMLPLFLQMGLHGGTVLDAGTGSGKGAVALAKTGFLPTLLDMTDAGLVDEAKAFPFEEGCLWHDLGARRFDYVYCTDVLEHVPTQFTMLAVQQMLRVCHIGLFISVSLVPDSFGVWAGKNLHQTVQPFLWWKQSFAEVGIVQESRDLMNNAVFFVRPHDR